MIEPLAKEPPRMDQCPFVNVSFALSGKHLPADHGYLVYSAISRATERLASSEVLTVRENGKIYDIRALKDVSVAHKGSLHKTDWLGIELISGFPSGPGLITLPERDATLRLRIPAEHYRDVLTLAGNRFNIGGHQIRLGLPVARNLPHA